MLITHILAFYTPSNKKFSSRCQPPDVSDCRRPISFDCWSVFVGSFMQCCGPDWFSALIVWMKITIHFPYIMFCVCVCVHIMFICWLFIHPVSQFECNCKCVTKLFCLFVYKNNVCLLHWNCVFSGLNVTFAQFYYIRQSFEGQKWCGKLKKSVFFLHLNVKHKN